MSSFADKTFTAPPLIRNFCIIAHIDHGKSTLADRMLQLTGVVDGRMMRAQYLDRMDIERERGITIKAQNVRLPWKVGSTEHVLHLIDTPGHVDFTYEVSRALEACEGAVLLVDAAQGIEAQTLANLYLALEKDLTIIPVLNKIDLPAADPDRYAAEIAHIVGCDAGDVLRVSAKTGQGVLRAARRGGAPGSRPRRATRRPGPRDDLRLGLRHLPRCHHLHPGRRRADHAARADQDDVHGCHPRDAGDRHRLAGAEAVRRAGRRRGGLPHHRREGRAPVEGRRHRHHAHAKAPRRRSPATASPGRWSTRGSTPWTAREYPDLREALDKLRLNDAALTYEPETSAALGFGFRCGFLGLLHLEITRDRLEREFGLELISTAPNVVYRVIKDDGMEMTRHQPVGLARRQGRADLRADRQDDDHRALASSSARSWSCARAVAASSAAWTTCPETRVELRYTMPLAEIIFDFFDALKSRTRGYASLDYEEAGEQEADLVKVDIMLQGEPVDAFSAIVHKDDAYAYGTMMTAKLRELIPRQQFEVPIQAAIGSRIIARENIRAIRKDVLAKCYGGDITRKRKLLEKQKEGKKRMKTIGRVEVPQEAFVAALSTDSSVDKTKK